MTNKRRKELRRVNAFIRRAEKRGYIFPEEFKKSISEKTTRALQFLTPRKLYEAAKFKIGSTEVAGLRGRQIERARSAMKAAATRAARRNKEVPPVPPLYGDIVYSRVRELIDSYPSSPAADYLNKLLKSEIATYGFDKVVRALGEAPEDMVKRAAEILHYEGDSARIHDSLRSFSELIRGSIPTIEESKELNNVLETV